MKIFSEYKPIHDTWCVNTAALDLLILCSWVKSLIYSNIYSNIFLPQDFKKDDKMILSDFLKSYIKEHQGDFSSVR